MKSIKYILSFIFIFIVFGCDEDVLLPSSFEKENSSVNSRSNDKVKLLKATGDIYVTFFSNPAGNGSGNSNMSQEGTQQFANVLFDAHEGDLQKPVKGNLEISILDEEDVIKRKFEAEVYDVKVDALTKEAYFLARVTSDYRSDEGHSDHEDSAGNHTGLGGITGNTNGGNHSNSNHSEEDDSHDSSDHGNGGNSDDEIHGSKSRIGHTIGVKVYDGGSPGTNGDKIGWKWYGENNPNTPASDVYPQWEQIHLKEILEGNLVVHLK